MISGCSCLYKLALPSLQAFNKKIYEESVTKKIKVEISTLLIKYLKVSSFRFFFLKIG